MLTPAHRARVRATQLETMKRRGQIWRTPPRASGGKTPAPVQVAADVPCQIWPAATAAKLIAAVPDVGSGRYDAIGFCLDDVDLRAGDELRVDDQRYKVAGIGRWATLLVAGLSELAS